jgi:hypothetical protein
MIPIIQYTLHENTQYESEHFTKWFLWRLHALAVCIIMVVIKFQGQNAQMHGLGQAQRALLGTISDGLSAVGDAQGDLESRAHLPPLGTDPVSISSSNTYYT